MDFILGKYYKSHQGGCRTEKGGYGTYSEPVVSVEEECKSICDDQDSCLAYEWIPYNVDIGKVGCEIHTDKILRGSGQDGGDICYIWTRNTTLLVLFLCFNIRASYL